MIVPFAAFVEFLQRQRPDLTLTPITLGNIGKNRGLLDIPKTSVTNYINGVRAEGKDAAQKPDTIKERIFKLKEILKKIQFKKFLFKILLRKNQYQLLKLKLKKHLFLKLLQL